MNELIAYIMGVLTSKPATFLLGMLAGIMTVGLIDTLKIYFTLKGLKNEKSTNKKRK